jgi:hypothetical protein
MRPRQDARLKACKSTVVFGKTSLAWATRSETPLDILPEVAILQILLRCNICPQRQPGGDDVV